MILRYFKKCTQKLTHIMQGSHGSKAKQILSQLNNLPIEQLSPAEKAEALEIMHRKLGLSAIEESNRKERGEAIKVLIEGL